MEDHPYYNSQEISYERSMWWIERFRKLMRKILQEKRLCIVL